LPASSVFALSDVDFFTGTSVGPLNEMRRASTTDIINGLSEIHRTPSMPRYNTRACRRTSSQRGDWKRGSWKLGTMKNAGVEIASVEKTRAWQGTGRSELRDQRRYFLKDFDIDIKAHTTGNAESANGTQMFSTRALWCHVFHSRVVHSCVFYSSISTTAIWCHVFLLPDFQLPRFQRTHASSILTLTYSVWLRGPSWRRPMTGRRTYYQEVVVLTPGWVAIKWLLFGWVTVCGQVKRLNI